MTPITNRFFNQK